MAFPIGAIGGSLAVVCASMNRHKEKSNNICLGLSPKQKEEIKTKSDRVLDFIETNFKAEVQVDSKFYYEFIYFLKFRDVNVGFRLENRILLNHSTEELCEYAYHLVRDELFKFTEKKYINKKEVINNE